MILNTEVDIFLCHTLGNQRQFIAVMHVLKAEVTGIFYTDQVHGRSRVLTVMHIHIHMYKQITIIAFMSPEIVDPPINTTVFINQTAVFECETSGGEITDWRINGTDFNNLPPNIQNDWKTDRHYNGSSWFYSLTVQATDRYNETRVQCVTGSFGGSSDESDNATLSIQGNHAKGSHRTLLLYAYYP